MGETDKKQRVRLCAAVALAILALAGCSSTKCLDGSECGDREFCSWDQVQTCSMSPLTVVVLSGHCVSTKGIELAPCQPPQFSCPAGCILDCGSTCVCETCPPSGDSVTWCSPRGPVSADQAVLGDVFPCVAPFVCGQVPDGGPCCYSSGYYSTSYATANCSPWPDAGKV